MSTPLKKQLNAYRQNPLSGDSVAAKVNSYQSRVLGTKSSPNGFTLVEVLVTVAIISLLFVGIFSLIILSLRVTAENQYYVEAIEIANQKMERIRNMPYDEIGVSGGIPGGNIPQVEMISRGGNFTVNTYVSFYDDPYDGTAGSGDTIINDYKIATVKVGWQGKYDPGNVTVFSKIIPRTEETAEGYGLLKISVTNANAEPLAGANVRVVNNFLVPPVDVTNITNADGILYLPALESFQSYEITATKTDEEWLGTYYGADQTYNLSTGKSPLHLSATESNKTEENFSIDRLARLQIKTVQNSLPDNWRVSSAEITRSMINPNFAIDSSDNMYFAWQNYTATSSYIHVQKYNSAQTKQWADDYKIDDVDSQNNPDITVSDLGNSFLVWDDDSAGNSDVYIVSLDSSGSERWTRKKVNGNIGSAAQTNSKIAITSDFATTTVVWQDERNGNVDIYAQSFDADGNALWASDLQVSSGAENEISPVAVFDSDNNIIISWTEDGAVSKNIYAEKFDLAGNDLWGGSVNIASESYDEYSPAITADNSENFYLSWTEDNAGILNIKIAKYNSAGVLQWSGVANLESPSSDQYEPALVADSSYIYISWTDDRGGDADIYAQKYDTNYNAQWAGDQKISVSLTGGSQSNSVLAINNSEENFSAWQDSRDGDYNIYATRFTDPSSLSGAANVPLRLYGSKTISETPVVYEFDQTFTTDANGEADFDLEWDTGYYLEINEPSVYEIKYLDPPAPLGILPGETKEWIVYVE